MSGTSWRKVPLLSSLLLFFGCAADVDGPTPTVTVVQHKDSGTGVICTCDDLPGCIKDKNDVLEITGDGFAPLPVKLLEEPGLELPDVTLIGPGQKIYVIRGDDPSQNPTAVRVDFIDPRTLQLTLTPEFVRTFPEGKYTVRVTNPNGNEGELPDAIEVVLGPVLDKVVPDTVCDELDTKITLTGKNFREGAKVVVGDGELTGVTVVSDTKIEATVPKGFPPGSYNISVVNPEGCASTLANGLLVVPPPQLDSVSPSSICTGGILTLKGKGFLPGASVTIGNTEISGSAVTVDPGGTTITVNVGPIQPGGPFDVSVKNADGCVSKTLTAAITVIPGPIIVAVDPSTVYSKVAFPIAIFGDRLDSVTSATVDAATPAALTISKKSTNRIDAVVPANIAPGTYSITVKDDKGCSYTLKDALVVTDQLTVRICAIDPPFGWDQEDTSVTITGGTGTGCSTGSTDFVSTPRAWLNVGGNLEALRAVAFVTATSLTGIVPEGLAVGGPYDLLVQNPDGGIGLLAKAFKVVSKPVPQIDSINPGDTDTQYVGKLTLFGKNFRAPVKIELIDSAGTKTNLAGAAVASGTEASANLDATKLSVGAYLVRLTNNDQGTYFDYSALAITNPAGNLGNWSASSDLLTARRRHAMVSGRISAAQRFLYVIGGDGGGAAPKGMSTVEVAPLDKFGGTGKWFQQRYALKAARTGVRAVNLGRYIHVLGGEGTGGLLKSIERAIILDPKQAPEIDTFIFEFVDPKDPNQSTLAKGIWYYRVSATMPASDPDNPGGETLPSDPVVLHLPVKNLKVTISWKPVAGAASYNVYRTPAPGGKFGEEQLLADGLTGTSYSDLGGAIKNKNQSPLKQGSTGVWVTSSVTLQTARSDAATAIAKVGGKPFVYLAGGRSGTGAASVLDTVELAAISADGKTLSAFQAGTNTLVSKAERPMLVVGDHDTSPKVPQGTVYLYTAGGDDGAKVYKNGSYSVLAASGQPGTWTTFPEIKNATFGAVGYMVNDTFYFFGGSSNGTSAISNAYSCEFTTPPAFQSCNSLASGALPTARMNGALTLESAFFYISGGGATDTAATKSVIKTVY
jgi:hypothetical protein